MGVEIPLPRNVSTPSLALPLQGGGNELNIINQKQLRDIGDGTRLVSTCRTTRNKNYRTFRVTRKPTMKINFKFAL
jgi:hypothetical protein